MRHFATVATALALLGGCAQAPLHTAPPRAAAAQPLATLTVATPPPERDAMAQLLTAEFALTHSDLRAAAKAYARAAAVSDDPEVAERAVGLAIATHDRAGAAAGIERWRALGADPAGLAQARAQLALNSGQTDEARRQLETLVATTDKDRWRNFGRILMSGRDAAQAGQLLESIATPQRLPDDVAAWLAMSELGDKLGREDYAQTLAATASKRFHTADTYAWQAQLAFKAGDKDQARALFARALALAPTDTRLRMSYAGMLAQEGDNAGAAHMLAHGPQDDVTYAARAAFAARAKDHAELARIYAQLKQAPQQLRDDSSYLLGQLADSLDKPAEALDWYAQVPVEDEHAYDATMRSAVIEHQQGRPGRAHQALARLQTDYASQPEQLQRAYRLDGDLYMQEGHFEAASTAYSNGLRVSADEPGLLYARGLAFAEEGRIDAAVDDLRRLLKLKPDDVDAANALGYTLADSNRDLGEAQRLIGQARHARPDDPAITDSWGWLQYRLGHLDKAAQALRKAWNGHKDPDVGAHLAEVLWKLGDTGEARRVLAEARKLDPGNPRLRAAQEKVGP